MEKLMLLWVTLGRLLSEMVEAKPIVFVKRYQKKIPGSINHFVDDAAPFLPGAHPKNQDDHDQSAASKRVAKPEITSNWRSLLNPSQDHDSAAFPALPKAPTVCTGLRKGSMYSLTWEMVDWDGR